MEANVATISLLSAFSENSLSSVVPTTVSLIVKPARSILVLSPIYKRTPEVPVSDMVLRSIGSPATGVKSILKSPLWKITPCGVSIENASEPAMEWFTFTG